MAQQNKDEMSDSSLRNRKVRPVKGFHVGIFFPDVPKQVLKCCLCLHVCFRRTHLAVLFVSKCLLSPAENTSNNQKHPLQVDLTMLQWANLAQVSISNIMLVCMPWTNIFGASLMRTLSQHCDRHNSLLYLV